MMRFAIGMVCALATAAHGQVFSILEQGPAERPAWSAEGPRPAQGAVVRVDPKALAALLEQAPDQRLDAHLRTYGLTIAIPGPSGEMIDCFVAESPVMEAPLQQRFPQMRTYIVQSVDGAASGRIELTPRGVTAMLRSASDDGAGGAWMIDPWRSGDANHAVSYWLRDLPGGGDWRCETAEGVHGFGAHVDEVDEGMTPRGAHMLGTLRIAVACTGEYGVHHSTLQGHEPNGADPLAAIVTVVARANVVYEADLGIHFNLVANNDQVIFFDPVADPYPDSCDGTGGGDCSGPHLAVNIDTLEKVIGNANFDVGHLVTRIFGGVAYLSSVCQSFKAGGISGIPRGGDLDPLSALVVIHELGHQFGANHTFSGTRGRCAGNVRLASAWEAGSGSSPMAYAGGCPVGDAPPTDNIVQFAQPFFHHGSVNEMRAFLNDNNSDCIVETVSGNAEPVLVSFTENTQIPPGTPFVLSAQATDGDGDTLMYSWEQFDSGVARPLSGEGATDNGSGSLFRIFPPVNATSRTFPRMADVLSGVPTPGERLPTVTDVVRRFRVIVRDNHPGAGGVAVSTSVRLTIPLGTSAFAVISPAPDAVLPAGTAAVTWSTGGTQNSPILCAGVTIRLDTNGQGTFDQVLGTFPNTGSAMVTLPAVDASAQLRIDGVGEIFFAVSRPFTIDGACAADFNGDGVRDSQDFFDFLGAFFKLESGADVNDDEIINSQDFFDFLSVFFAAGC